MKARIFILACLLALFASSPAFACAACWGDTTGSKMGNAAAVSIGVMVVIVFGMLGTLIGFGFYLARRAKNPLPDYEELLGDESTTPNPGTTS